MNSIRDNSYRDRSPTAKPSIAVCYLDHGSLGTDNTNSNINETVNPYGETNSIAP
jgi:hypothetical protein